MARVGRLLLTAAALGGGVSHALADVNRTHVFNPRWTPHARFHAASSVATDVSSLSALGYLLARADDRASR